MSNSLDFHHKTQRSDLGPSLLNKLIMGVGAACALLVAADFVVQKHPHFAWEGWGAFFGLFGFASYSFIVYAGRALRKIVMRKEDYYE